MTQRFVYFFGQGQAEGSIELKHLIGGKGASLADMTRAQLNVPPGFTISAECCALFYQNKQTWSAGLLDEIKANLARLEQVTGRTLGEGANPLLVAVRSGAAQSMPGMMDTILNVGLNPHCVKAMAERTGNARGAWEAYLHFLLMFIRTVEVPARPTNEDDLTGTVADFLKREKASAEEKLDAKQLECLCGEILHRFANKGAGFPTAPWDMLEAAIRRRFPLLEQRAPRKPTVATTKSRAFWARPSMCRRCAPAKFPGSCSRPIQ